MFQNLLRVGLILSIVTLVGCSVGNSAKETATQSPRPADQVPKTPQLPDLTYTKSFKAGSDIGYKEGKDWGIDGLNGLPQESVLSHMANGWAEQKGKTNDNAWKQGWVDGFKNGFASTRGGKKVLEENPNYENLSLENARVGAELYNNTEKHEATIVTVDKEAGLIYVRYVKSGSVEPKSITALSKTWFVKR